MSTTTKNQKPHIRALGKSKHRINRAVTICGANATRADVSWRRGYDAGCESGSEAVDPELRKLLCAECVNQVDGVHEYPDG